MFTVIERTGATFIDGEEVIGTFATFDEAHEFAQKNVCADVCNEGSPQNYYWFSDESDPNTPYKVKIRFIA